MKKKSKRYLVLAGTLFLLFAVFTGLVTTVDVRPIGPQNSFVGLATLNQKMLDWLGVNPTWYKITDEIGVFALLVAGGFAVLGLSQLLRRKSLWKVDASILLLGIFYVLTAALYLLFETVIINYRPILLDGRLEASYPSSHTILVICVMGTAILQFRRMFHAKRGLCAALVGASLLLTVLTVFGRLISGVHWFTDILGGVLLAFALVALYYGVVCRQEER